MQEASRWRYALAQQIVSHAHTNPKVAAVVVEGSVARGYADLSSDLDLAVFWAEPPTKQERRDIITRALERDSHPWSSFRTAAGWQTRTVRAGGAIDVRHTTVAAIEGLLAAVLEHADPRLARQQRLAALCSALPLVNPVLITGWQQQAAAYPPALAVAMVRTHLRFRPAWEQELLAERKDVLVLYDSLCTAHKQLLLVLLGLNRLYFPGWRSLDRLLDKLQVTPPNLSPRLKQLFAVVSIDPLASVYQLHDLIEETFRLVETHLGEVDTRAARERFHGQRRR
jgi:predicted nucleotidyltransferase